MTWSQRGRKGGRSSAIHILDICQLVAILVIPELLQEAAKDTEDTKLFFAFHSELGGALPATKPALRQAMKDNGLIIEDDDVPEELLDAMMEVSKNGDDTIAALTSDLGLFDLEWKNTNTTIFDDVHKVDPNASKSVTKEEPIIVSKEGDPQQDGSKATRVYTAPGIDYSADTCRRPLAVMLLWSSGLAAHFSYVLKTVNDGEWLQANCSGDATACTIADGIVRWLAIFFQLVLLGLPFIFLGSLGNSVYVSRKWNSILRTCISIVTVVMFTVVPFFKVRSCVSRPVSLLLCSLT